VEEFAQWRIVLLKKSGKRLDIGVVTAARSRADEAFERARLVAAAIAALASAPLELPRSTPTATTAPSTAPRRRRATRGRSRR
jgi:hypothetical protein